MPLLYLSGMLPPHMLMRTLCGLVQNVGGSWLSDALGGAAREGGLTEAQLSDELGPGYRELPPALRNARATINWWQVSRRHRCPVPWLFFRPSAAAGPWQAPLRHMLLMCGVPGHCFAVPVSCCRHLTLAGCLSTTLHLASCNMQASDHCLTSPICYSFALWPGPFDDPCCALAAHAGAPGCHEARSLGAQGAATPQRHHSCAACPGAERCIQWHPR